MGCNTSASRDKLNRKLVVGPSMLRPIAGWHTLGLTHASVTVLRSITSMRDERDKACRVLVERVPPQTLMCDEQSVVFGRIAFFYTVESNSH